MDYHSLLPILSLDAQQWLYFSRWEKCDTIIESWSGWIKLILKENSNVSIEHTIPWAT